tara:strand:+ start:1815 stop:2303 length:489 start_codon:yes stop_codon:yes gene_type:complete
MIKENITISYLRAKFNDLTVIEKELIQRSKDALKDAYAPYSGFLVGSSVLLSDGKIISANNQENVAFPSGLCAERVVLFNAGANYPNLEIDIIAVSAKSNLYEITDIISPCGACRQVMAEYQQKQNKKIKILLHLNNDEVLIFSSVDDLLPLLFTNPNLKKI